MVTQLRIGVVGLGGVTNLVYVPLLARNPDRFRVTAVCDVLQERVDAFAEVHGIPPGGRFTSLEALLEAGPVDALLLLTSGSHGPALQAAQRADVPVLCEKPLAYTVAEVDALDPAARVQLGYMKLHDPAVAEAARAVRDLGRTRSVEVLVLHPSPAQQLRHVRQGPPASPAAPGPDPVVHDLQVEALGEAAAARFGNLYTGVVLGSIIHELSLVRALAGPITDIAHADVWPDGADPPSMEVLGDIDGGARLSIRWHYLPDYPAYREEVRVHGEEGSVDLVFPTPYVLNAPTELVVTTRWGAGQGTRRFTAFDEAFERQLDAFHAFVTSGTPPVAGVQEGRADIVVCQRIVRRLAERRDVPVAGEARHA